MAGKTNANLQDNFVQNYTEKPDYGRCVAIVASASLREMIKPGALAILSPMAVGEFFFSEMEGVPPASASKGCTQPWVWELWYYGSDISCF